VGETPERLLAGEVGKPHGLTGEVYVVPISDDPRRFQPGSTLQREDGSVLTIVASRTQGNRLLVTFEQASDRDSAATMRGPLYVPADDARSLEEGEFWPHELTGMDVEAGGVHVGTVVEVVPGNAQDLLKIETPAGERLVPLVDDIVVSIDTETRRIVIDPPEGLLD
jgi:16S rRNA processing protein RimM